MLKCPLGLHAVPVIEPQVRVTVPYIRVSGQQTFRSGWIEGDGMGWKAKIQQVLKRNVILQANGGAVIAGANVMVQSTTGVHPWANVGQHRPAFVNATIR
jgi:hypothetical protein